MSDDRDRRPLPHALVGRENESIALTLGIDPALGRRPVWLTFEREDGETTRTRLGSEDGQLVDLTCADGRPGRVWRVDLPALPLGRHRVWRDDAPGSGCHITVAPHRCYLPPAIGDGGRRFGISAQLYAQRRANDAGIGDFMTLAMLARAAAREGAATIGINPLHMLFPGQRERASPYHPSDRRFIDPIYLDLPSAEKNLSAGDIVAYSDVWASKSAALERLFTNKRPSAAFDRFVLDGGVTLRRFGIFQAIAETRPGETWHQWPAELRSPGNDAVEAFASAHAHRVTFHQYLQFLADRQFAAAVADGGLELGIYRDLAVGAAPDGAESWADSLDLADGAWIGAPPDPFAALGQNWHLPPPLPLAFARDGYARFAALIAANMRHAGALRIDHVMGLSRLFWIPDGATGADGAYVAYPFADLLGQVALESTRARCMVVGEDLGTVPEGFRQTMSEADIFSYRVMLLERNGRDFNPASSYPARAVACVTTHDLPPLAGWWEAVDIRERVALGLLQSEADAAKERDAERSALVKALTAEGVMERDVETIDPPGAVHGDQSTADAHHEDRSLHPPAGNHEDISARRAAGDQRDERGVDPSNSETKPLSTQPSVETVVTAAYQFIAATSSELVLVQAEDLARMRTGVNLPGTDRERPNWRLRLTEPVETLLSSPTARPILEALRARGRGAQRRGRRTDPVRARRAPAQHTSRSAGSSGHLAAVPARARSIRRSDPPRIPA